MYNQWATAPGRSLSYPRPKSITHLRTFSDNGVYVALQLFLVIVVSDQWRRVLIPYSYRQAPWGLLHARGWLSRYTWDQRFYVVSEPRETHSSIVILSGDSYAPVLFYYGSSTSFQGRHARYGCTCLRFSGCRDTVWNILANVHSGNRLPWAPVSTLTRMLSMTCRCGSWIRSDVNSWSS